jgi:hypothetical protein
MSVSQTFALHLATEAATADGRCLQIITPLCCTIQIEDQRASQPTGRRSRLY